MTALVEANGQVLELGAPASGVMWLGQNALFADGDGRVHVVAPGEAARVVEAHDGAVLSLVRDPSGKHVLTGGDDGFIKKISADGDVEDFASLRGKWIDHLVASPASGAVVAGVGKEAVVFVKGPAGFRESHRFTHPSTIGGLALDAKGRRLAVSHYGGVTLRYVLAADDKGQALEWKGSHLSVTMSPDTSYVFTSMQENELHGWRMPEKKDLRMSGYAAKSRWLSWDKKGKWLATSGADCLVVWPFQGKLGPEGKQPATLVAREGVLITACVFHPSEDFVLVGWSDGAVLIVRVSDQAAIAVDSGAGAPVTALAWDDEGMKVAYADENGRAAVASMGA